MNNYYGNIRNQTKIQQPQGCTVSQSDGNGHEKGLFDPITASCGSGLKYKHCCMKKNA